MRFSKFFSLLEFKINERKLKRDLVAPNIGIGLEIGLIYCDCLFIDRENQPQDRHHCAEDVERGGHCG